MQLCFLCYASSVNPVQYILRHSDAKLIVYLQYLLSKRIEIDFVNLSFEATGFVNVLDVPSKPRLLKPDEVRTMRKNN